MKKCLLLCLLIIDVKAQISSVKKIATLDILTISNDALKPILDTVISVEKSREYYRSDMMFSVQFNKDSTIILGALDIPYKLNTLGVILYKNTVFLVSGSSTGILSVSDQQKDLELFTDSVYKNERTGEDVFIISREDGFSKWIYRYGCCGFEFDEISLLDEVRKKAFPWILPDHRTVQSHDLALILGASPKEDNN